MSNVYDWGGSNAYTTASYFRIALDTDGELYEVELDTADYDSDGDGIRDDEDPDDDNDGVPDAEDDRPLDPNESVDLDGDKIGDNADSDDDNDGIPDEDDYFPTDNRMTSEICDERVVTGEPCLEDQPYRLNRSGVTREALVFHIANADSSNTMMIGDLLRNAVGTYVAGFETGSPLFSIFLEVVGEYPYDTLWPISQVDGAHVAALKLLDDGLYLENHFGGQKRVVDLFPSAAATALMLVVDDQGTLTVLEVGGSDDLAIEVRVIWARGHSGPPGGLVLDTTDPLYQVANVYFTDSDGDGVPDGEDTCPLNELVPTTVNSLPRDQAECDSSVWSQDLEWFEAGADGVAGTADDCSQYAISPETMKSVRTVYHVATNVQGNAICSSSGLCRVAQGVAWLFRKTEQAGPEDQVEPQDLLNGLEDTDQSDDRLPSDFPDTMIGHLQTLTVSWANQMTDYLNAHMMDATERRTAHLMHGALGVGEEELYCALKGTTGAAQSFAVGAIIGALDIPGFFDSLIEHPVQTVEDLFQLVVVFVTDPGEGLRAFLGLDIEETDSGAN
ncbi:MAG: hypothetical protein AAFX94_13650, partial [Myxococcota bacterium]